MNAHLFEELKKNTGKEIHIKMNQNKSHYFVFKESKSSIHLSLHHFFFNAPKEVSDAVISYVLKKKAQDYLVIKKFIHKEQNQMDFSHLLKKRALKTKGNYFDLNERYHLVNQKHFDGKLNLSIAWFYPTYTSFKQITFGSYDRAYKLIKINDHLDHPKVSFEYMDYLIFHEMLHEVYPSQITKAGRYQIHTRQFNAHERSFPDFMKIKKFEDYFIKKIWRKNGRT